MTATTPFDRSGRTALVTGQTLDADGGLYGILGDVLPRLE